MISNQRHVFVTPTKKGKAEKDPKGRSGSQSLMRSQAKNSTSYEQGMVREGLDGGQNYVNCPQNAPNSVMSKGVFSILLEAKNVPRRSRSRQEHQMEKNRRYLEGIERHLKYLKSPKEKISRKAKIPKLVKKVEKLSHNWQKRSMMVESELITQVETVEGLKSAQKTRYVKRDENGEILIPVLNFEFKQLESYSGRPLGPSMDDFDTNDVKNVNVKQKQRREFYGPESGLRYVEGCLNDKENIHHIQNQLQTSQQPPDNSYLQNFWKTPSKNIKLEVSGQKTGSSQVKEPKNHQEMTQNQFESRTKNVEKNSKKLNKEKNLGPLGIAFTQPGGHERNLIQYRKQKHLSFGRSSGMDIDPNLGIIQTPESQNRPKVKVVKEGFVEAPQLLQYQPSESQFLPKTSSENNPIDLKTSSLQTKQGAQVDLGVLKTSQISENWVKHSFEKSSRIQLVPAIELDTKTPKTLQRHLKHPTNPLESQNHSKIQISFNKAQRQKIIKQSREGCSGGSTSFGTNAFYTYKSISDLGSLENSKQLKNFLSSNATSSDDLVASEVIKSIINHGNGVRIIQNIQEEQNRRMIKGLNLSKKIASSSQYSGSRSSLRRSQTPRISNRSVKRGLASTSSLNRSQRPPLDSRLNRPSERPSKSPRRRIRCSIVPRPSRKSLNRILTPENRVPSEVHFSFFGKALHPAPNLNYGAYCDNKKLIDECVHRSRGRMATETSRNERMPKSRRKGFGEFVGVGRRPRSSMLRSRVGRRSTTVGISNSRPVTSARPARVGLRSKTQSLGDRLSAGLQHSRFLDSSLSGLAVNVPIDSTAGFSRPRLVSVNSMMMKYI